MSKKSMLTEKFGEPIGKTKALVGIADERDKPLKNGAIDAGWGAKFDKSANICESCGHMDEDVEAESCLNCDKAELDEVAPPGWEGTIKAMKKDKEINNPFALAWSMKNKGYKSHKKNKK